MAILLALASSACWGTADFFGGLFTRRIHPVKTVALSQAGGLLAILVVLAGWLLAGRSPSGWGFVGWGMASGLVGCLGLVSFYAALSRGTMGVVSPIAALGALVPVVLGVLGGDRLGALVLVGMALALVGVVLASGPELSGEVSRLPVILAAVAAVSFGLSLFFLHHASRSGVLPALVIMRVASVSVLATIWWVQRRSLPCGEVRRRDLAGLGVTGCGDLAANGLFGAASTFGMVSLVSMLGSLYPIATIVLARGLLGEQLRRIQQLGVLCALAGVALVAA